MATAGVGLGLILPATVTLIFKNGCTQTSSPSRGHSHTNGHDKGTRSGVGATGNPSTDISTNLLQHAASSQKAKANEIP